MLKKTIFIVSAILLTVIMFFQGFASGPTISVGSVEAMPGETVTVPVSISGNPGINTFSFGFLYDTSRLMLMGVEPSSKLGGQFVYKKKAVWLNSSDLKYNGDLLYVTFKVSDSAEYGEYDISVTYSPGAISDYNEDDVDFAVVPGKIVIGNNQTNVSKIRAIIKRMIEIIKTLVAIFKV